MYVCLPSYITSPFVDEVPTEEVKTTNLLADLLQRFYVEQDALIGWIRSPDHKVKGQVEQQLPLVMVQLENLYTAHEEDFEVAALAVGLVERIMAAKNTR